VIISQITFCGIIVEVIWSYNQYNFFFWLQIYSAYSSYTCLNAILHNKYERVLPLVFLFISLLLSRLLHLVVKLILNGETLNTLISALTNKISGAQAEDWIGP